MRTQRISVTTAVYLLVFCCVGCAHKKSEPQSDLAGNQPTQANDFDRARKLKLQGVLKDHEGKRLTGVVGVVFAIYQQQEGGAPVWKEVQNLELDERGHYAALVGSTKPEGIPPELFPTEKALWLGRQVLLPGETEQPRKRLLSTPYGLMVERVARLVIPSDDSSRQQDHSRPAKTRVK